MSAEPTADEAPSPWVLGALSTIVVLLVWQIVGVPNETIDAYPSLAAAELWLQGDLASIYPEGSAFRNAEGAWGSAMERIGAPESTTSFVYAPGVILFYAPLRLAGLETLGLALLLRMLNAIAVSALAFASARALSRPTWALPIALAFSLAFVTRQTVALGQNTLFLGAAFALLLPRSGWTAAAVNGALCAHFKPWSPVLALAYVGKGKADEAVAYLAGSIGSVIALGLLAGPALLTRFTALVSSLAGATQLRFTNFTVGAFVTRLTTPDWTSLGWTYEAVPMTGAARLVTWLGLLGLALAAWRRRPDARGFWLLATAPVFLSVGWHHYLCIALPFVLEACLQKRWLGYIAAFWLGIAMQFVWVLATPDAAPLALDLLAVVPSALMLGLLLTDRS